MEIATATRIEALEDEYVYFARLAKTAPHKWGQDEEDTLAELRTDLLAAYAAAGVADDDRLAGFETENI